LSDASDNMYVSEFRNAPLADMQLFAGATSAVLEKSSKNPIVLQAAHRACALQQESCRPRSGHYTRPAPVAIFTPTAPRDLRPLLYCQ